jgi:hypothetical protein
VHRTTCHNFSPWRYELHLEPRQYLPNPCHRHAKPPGSCPKEMLLPGLGQRRKGDSSRTKPVTTSRGRENGRTHDKPSSTRSSDRLNNRVQSQHHQSIPPSRSFSIHGILDNNTEPPIQLPPPSPPASAHRKPAGQSRAADAWNSKNSRNCHGRCSSHFFCSPARLLSARDASGGMGSTRSSR